MTPFEKALLSMVASLSSRLTQTQTDIELLLQRPTWERVQYLEKQLMEANKNRRKK